MRHDEGVRARAVELIERGYGERTLARELAISVSIAKKWILTCRSVGKEVLLGMGANRKAYDYETKLAAARDHVDGGIPCSEVMSAYGIASVTSLQRWCKAYRELGPEALRPRPKGRPRGSAPLTREGRLEERVRYLEAENAYLKKCRALMAQRASRAGRDPE